MSIFKITSPRIPYNVLIEARVRSHVIMHWVSDLGTSDMSHLMLVPDELLALQHSPIFTPPSCPRTCLWCFELTFDCLRLELFVIGMLLDNSPSSFFIISNSMNLNFEWLSTRVSSYVHSEVWYLSSHKFNISMMFARLFIYFLDIGQLKFWVQMYHQDCVVTLQQGCTAPGNTATAVTLTGVLHCHLYKYGTMCCSFSVSKLDFV